VGNFAAYLHPYRFGSSTQLLADFQLYAAHPTRYTPLYLGHFWTLCVEEQFYLVWPWIVFGLRDRRKLIWICGASLPICLAARILGTHLLPGWMLQQGVLSHATPFCVDELLLGALLALMLRSPFAPALLRSARIATPVAFAIALVWALLTPARHIFEIPYPYPRSLVTWGLTTISMLTGLVILVAIQPGTVLFRTLRLYPLRWIGRISYGAYVFHDIVHVICGQILYHFVLRHIRQRGFMGRMISVSPAIPYAFFALLVTLLLAWLSFRFFESRFLNLKERWTVR
jgi:peptidoglycan/LPS O-acetylase OafA/YrhL